jgi:hypothetical protein
VITQQTLVKVNAFVRVWSTEIIGRCGYQTHANWMKLDRKLEGPAATSRKVAGYADTMETVFTSAEAIDLSRFDRKAND